MTTLIEKLADRSAEVAVIGAGYVGLPLAVEIANAGYHTVTYDRDVAKVDAINAGRSYIGDVPSLVLKPLLQEGRLVLHHTTLDRVWEFDCVVIATDHSDVDYHLLVERSRLVLDTRNATKAVRSAFAERIVLL